MKTRTLTAIALLFALSACNRATPTNNSAAPVNAAANTAALTPAPAPIAPANGATANAAASQNDQSRRPIAPPKPEGCAGEIGVAEARALVAQCIEVSPATRPPCNVANNCALIQSEIDRSCAMISEDAPAFCAQ